MVFQCHGVVTDVCISETCLRRPANVKRPCICTPARSCGSESALSSSLPPLKPLNCRIDHTSNFLPLHHHHAQRLKPSPERLRILHNSRLGRRPCHCPCQSRLDTNAPIKRWQLEITEYSGVSCKHQESRSTLHENEAHKSVLPRVKGRPHYYSQKKEEYAHIKFDLDVGKHHHLDSTFF